jgi:hypothetical protein
MLAASAVLLSFAVLNHAQIDRKSILSRYNPVRTSGANLSTPMQVGNGNFAFGADITGLQTFDPFAIMSSWGWKNDSLPPNRTWEDVVNYQGVSWPSHGRPVEYDFGGDALVQQWLISNPNRVNLGSVGLVFYAADGSKLNATLDDVMNTTQTLDLWTGTITSTFTFDGEEVTVNTTCAQDSDAISVLVRSSLLSQRRLGIFLDYPWNDGSQKFSAPFVGSFSLPANHTTILDADAHLGSNVRAQVVHTMVNSTFITSVGGSTFNISRDSPELHRYTILPATIDTNFSLVVGYSLHPLLSLSDVDHVSISSSSEWEMYWTESGFVDVVSGSTDARADELQRRIILSRYLMRVNEAGDNPPQEVSLLHQCNSHLTRLTSLLVWPGKQRLGSCSPYLLCLFLHLTHGFIVWKVPHGGVLLARGALGTLGKLGSFESLNTDLFPIP